MSEDQQRTLGYSRVPMSNLFFFQILAIQPEIWDRPERRQFHRHTVPYVSGVLTALSTM
jgi:hypothetical protein